MTTYQGAPIRGEGSIAIAAPSGVDLLTIADDERWGSAGGAAANTKQAIAMWTKAAEERDDIVLFEITDDGNLVGQIFLHDIDESRSESLVGYHLINAQSRGRGVGTQALRLLVDYARDGTDIETLVIITAGDNVRSRRIAEKNGFSLVGAPREDPDGCCFKLRLRRQ